MKGTEKQIKWAEEIIEEARGTININIDKIQKELARVGHVSTLEDNLEIWEKMQVAYEKLISGIDDAAIIIGKKDELNGHGMVVEFDRLSRILQEKQFAEAVSKIKK